MIDRAQLAEVIFNTQAAFQREHGIRDGYIDQWHLLAADDFAHEEYRVIADAVLELLVGPHNRESVEAERDRLRAQLAEVIWNAQHGRFELGTWSNAEEYPGIRQACFDAADAVLALMGPEVARLEGHNADLRGELGCAVVAHGSLCIAEKNRLREQVRVLRGALVEWDEHQDACTDCVTDLCGFGTQTFLHLHALARTAPESG